MINPLGRSAEKGAMPEARAGRRARWVERLGARLAPPVFDDPEATRIARVLHVLAVWIASLMLATALLELSPRLAPDPEPAWLIQGMIVALMLLVLGMVRRGRVRLAAAVFSSALWCLVTAITFFMGGINSPSIAAYLLVAVLAGFLWGHPGLIVSSALTALAASGMVAAELAGVRPAAIAPVTPQYAGLVLVLSLVVTSVLVRLSMGATDTALEEARRNERAAVEASRAVEAGRSLLETRAREQAAVAQLGQLALAEPELAAFMREAAAVIGGTLEVAYVSVLEHLADQEAMLLRSGMGWPDEALGTARFPMSLATQAGYTLLTGQPVLVDDQEREARFPASLGLRGLGIVSSLSVVIPGEDAPFGVLGAHATGRRRYTRDDIRFLEAVANLLALAVRRSRAHEALRAREEELRQAQKMEAMGRFAGGIAHDFNNLLTAIAGHTTFLERSLALDHPGRADALEIARVTERAASLTRQILAFSRRQVLQPEIIDLNDVIRNTEGMLRRMIGEDVELTCRLALDLAAVRADPGQMEQVLLNLAVNARDAMPRGGQLRISTANEDGPPPRVCVEVSDTGVGMDPETQARVFDPFFTTKDRFKGTGLGLSTVYGIVQQSEGSIAVHSQKGRGTAFRILLPASTAMPRAMRLRAEATPERGSETVLLAEDEATVRRLMRRILDENGYTVLEARDGAEALALARQHAGPIDLLVTDVVMPEMGGGELTERLKALHPEARVLYVSGYADEATEPHGVLGGGSSFLAKPFSFEALARKVREVLDAPGAG